MRRALSLIRVPVVIGLSLLSLAALAADVNTKSRFDLSAQPLAKALNAFAVQAGINIYFDPPAVAGLESPPLKAELTAGDALARLLAGTRLRAVYVNENTVRVVPVGAAASGASATEKDAMEGLQLARTGEQPQTVTQVDTTQQARNAGKPDTAAHGGSGGEKLEEIIVTATKRAQNIQDVPLSIAAVSAEEIDRRGLVSAEDYLRGIPGVNQVGNINGQSIVIRGIETSPQSQNFSSGTTVATYFGETPTTNSGGLSGGTNIDLKLVDIERVEVLRGPQGTAFGNSSLGGAVRTIPVAPKVDRFEAKVGAGYSVTSGNGGGNHMIQAIGNVPLIKDKLAIRATAYQFQDSGIYRNIAGSDPTAQALAAQYGAQAYATNKEDRGASEFTGGRIAALFQATDALKFTVGYLTQKTEIDGQQLAGGQTSGGIYDQAVLGVAPEHVTRGQKDGVFDTDIDLANATMEYGFGWGDLVAAFSHIDSSSLYTQSFFSATPYSSRGWSEHSEKSGEVRLTTKFSGAWNFLAGVYAEDLDDEALYDYFWFGDPVRSPYGTNRAIGLYSDIRNLKQKAAFAEVSWELLHGLTLTGGIRAYDYERTTLVSTSGALFGPAAVTDRKSDANGTSLRANLSYKFNDDALVYASWSQGFRLGKPQPGLQPGVCDLNNDGIVDGTSVSIESTRSVDSDEVDNLELGGKFTLLDDRLMISADVYRIKWTGVPFRVLAPLAPDGCGLAFNANAGSALSEGIEFQANFYLTRALRVDAGGSSIRAELTEDAPGLVPPGFDGDRLPGSPKLNANLGLQYEFAIAGHEASVRADSIYVGEFYGDLQRTALTRSGDYVKVDASARVTIKNLNIDLFVRNLTDIDNFTWRGPSNSGRGAFFGYRVRPRTIGVQLGYSF